MGGGKERGRMERWSEGGGRERSEGGGRKKGGREKGGREKGGKQGMEGVRGRKFGVRKKGPISDLTTTTGELTILTVLPHS